ncbi:MAG: cell division protein SepF [Clostridia bacterium]|jgi:cell division inhibitor SepF|nr:cell division protein SepF [Clostridia bacterium]
MAWINRKKRNLEVDDDVDAEEFDDYEQEQEEEEEEEYAPAAEEPAPRSATARRQTYASASKSEAANTRTLYNNGEPKSVIDIRTPETREEAYEIADCLLKGHSVTINLEVINRELASRILDFLGGVTYACGGELIKVTKTTWMVTPGDVGVNRQGFLSDTENNDAYFG